MEIQVIHPTLEDYSIRVNTLAAKYEKDSWLAFVLDPSVMDEDDRDEFAFIYAALGDRLISREFDLMSAAISFEDVANEECEKPGVSPGTAVFAGVELGRQRIYRLN